MNSFHSFANLLLGICFLVSSTTTFAAQQQKALCADGAGVFLGLATDKDAYITVKGSPGDGDGKEAQDWQLTDEPRIDPMSGDKPKGPQHSYDGRFLQVLPDSGRSYPPRGGHLEHASDLDKKDNRSPYVSFLLRVKKGGEGIHTAFVRWTGGDTVGGGDSFYVVLYKREKKNQLKLVRGQETVKPAVIPIDAGMSKFEGCCYDMVTHACPCFDEQPANTTCPNWIERSRATTFGVQCRLGGGAMVIVRDPEWYLFAGQEAGDVMDFDSEPWDTTCEAMGSNTRDSGHDFPSWYLDKGDYELRLYAREDGTALDGVYIAGPTAQAPIVTTRYSKGDSTICVKPPIGIGTIVSYASIGIIVVVLAWFANTNRGREVLGSVLNKPAQAVRYVYVES